MVIVGLLQTSVPWYFLGLSETRLPSSVASVLNATTPLWTIIIGYRWFNRKVHRNQWLGLVFGFCGILILLDFHPEHFFSVDSFGVFAMLIVTFCYGYSAQVSKRDLSDLTLYQSVFGTMLIGCLSSGLFAISFEPITLRSLLTQPSVLFSFFMLGSMGSAIGYILFYYMVQKGSAEFSTMVTYLVPVTAMIWGYLFLGESIHWTLLLGFLLILLGVFLSNRKPKLTEKKISENPSIKL